MMHNARADILELFAEAQLLHPHDVSPYLHISWLTIVHGTPMVMRGEEGSTLPGCGLCATRGHSWRTCPQFTGRPREEHQRALKSQKNARQAARNPRRAYRTAWQAEKDLKEAMNKLRGGYVPVRWGKRWKLARAALEQEKGAS